MFFSCPLSPLCCPAVADTSSYNQTTPEYHWSSDDLDWTYARQWCREHYTDMVSVQTREESHLLDQIVPPGIYWIGIRRVNGVFIWVESGQNVTMEAENWAPGEPNDYGQGEDCVEIYIKNPHQGYNGKWNDAACNHGSIRALCYKGRLQLFSNYSHI